MSLSSLARAGDRAPMPWFTYMTAAARAVADLDAAACRWPLGAPADADFAFCGGRRLARGSYCAVHARAARDGGGKVVDSKAGFRP